MDLSGNLISYRKDDDQTAQIQSNFGAPRKSHVAEDPVGWLPALFFLEEDESTCGLQTLRRKRLLLVWLSVPIMFISS